MNKKWTHVLVAQIYSPLSVIVSCSDGNTCFYGKCYYCKPAERACAKGAIMEGSVTIWLPDWYKLKTYRHPYQRTYRDGVLAKSVERVRM